jgi:pantetheine-phosphate adenylyltransferase
MFSVEERTTMAKRSLEGMENVKVFLIKGLLVDFAYEHNISVIVKGVRNTVDFNYENILHQVGESQKLGIDTFILIARPELAHISSSAVKDILKEQGYIHEYVPLYVKQCLEIKMFKQYIIGVTGEIGVGKSYVSKTITSFSKWLNIPIHNIELDHLGHQILEQLTEPKYEEVRNKLVDCFGPGIKKDNGMINRKNLGHIVFNDQKALKKLNTIMLKPILVRLKREIYQKSGLIILNAALLAESDMSYLCNNNLILVNCDKQLQEKRIISRSLNKSQIKRRIESQFSFPQKRKIIEEKISKDKQGKLWVLDNSGNTNNSKIKSTVVSILKYFGIS